MYQVIEQTKEEQMEMYMQVPKNKLAEMLINCNNILKIQMHVEGLNQNNNSVKFITGCSDCPVCDENDMAKGYNCKLKEFPDNYIRESEEYKAITPKWCPLKKDSILLTYIE